MKKIIGILMVMFVVALSGCETVKGFGEDMKSAGDAISKKASE